MNYRQLGATGLLVSEIGMGCGGIVCIAAIVRPVRKILMWRL